MVVANTMQEPWEVCSFCVILTYTSSQFPYWTCAFSQFLKIESQSLTRIISFLKSPLKTPIAKPADLSPYPSTPIPYRQITAMSQSTTPLSPPPFTDNSSIYRDLRRDLNPPFRPDETTIATDKPRFLGLNYLALLKYPKFAGKIMIGATSAIISEIACNAKGIFGVMIDFTQKSEGFFGALVERHSNNNKQVVLVSFFPHDFRWAFIATRENWVTGTSH